MRREEKRRHPRFSVGSNRRCWLQHTDESAIAVEVSDVSRSGIGISSDTPLENRPEHTFVMKSSWIDHDIPVTVRLVWEDQAGGRPHYGARFVRIRPENVFELLDPLYHDWLEAAVPSPL